MKFSVKLTALFTGIMLLSGVLISYLVYVYNINAAEKLVRDRLENQAFHTISKIDMMLHERGEDVKKIASDPIINNREVIPEKILKRLNEFKKLNNDFESLSFFDLNRVRLVDTSGEDIGIQHPLSTYWVDINSGKELAVDISRSVSLDKPVMHFASLVRDRKGDPFGVIVTRSSIEQINEIIQQAVGIFDPQKDFRVDLTDKNGLVLFSNYNEKMILKEKTPDLDYLTGHFKDVRGGSLRHTHPGVDEEFFAFAVEPGYDSFKGSNWRLIISMSSEKAFASVIDIRRNVIVILVLISAFSIFLISVFSRTVTRPIEDLSNASAEIKKGNLDVNVRISSKDEISKLAESFNEMAEELRMSRDRMLSYNRELEKGIAEGTKRVNEINEQLHEELAERKRVEEVLRKNEEHFRVFMNYNPSIAWIKDDGFRFVYVNTRMETVFKRSLNEWTGKTDFDLFPDETAKKLRKNDENVIRAGAAIETEESFAIPGGELRHWEVFKFPLLESSGRYFIGGMAIDITDRKSAEDALLKAKNELEAKVLERTAELTEANTKLSARAQELEELNRQGTIFGNMIELLQACNEIEKAYSIISKSFSRLFPADSGGLYILNSSKNLLEAVAVWGENPLTEKFFNPDDCWALRRGQSHIVADPKTGVNCRHESYTDSASVCVPLLAQGEPLGVLSLAMEPHNYSDPKGQLIASLAEQTGLAVSNLRLRDMLRNLSIRDSLTSLYNRRYLEESIAREMSRSARSGKSMGLIMIDIDHFKKFNDTYGHDAGDALLREFGLLLMKRVRNSDIACRYGGEEFSVILPETSLEVALKRAEYLREEVKHLHVQSGGQLFRQITVSLGVAIFPIHGNTKEELSMAADAALYKAKRNGRDQIVIAERRLPESYNQGKLFVTSQI